MDFSTGIPADQCTMVAVPTMLSSPDGVDGLLEGLEMAYLANRDDNLHFALLTDLEDAPQEVMESDEELVRLAREGIEQLVTRNTRVRPMPDIFFTFAIVHAGGTPGKASGWASNASAASWPSSTVSCAASGIRLL